jgi:predicted ATPase
LWLSFITRRQDRAQLVKCCDCANGSGKSSLYRALKLLADVARGRIVQSLAAEGGLRSALWTGPESFARSVKNGDHPVQGTQRKASLSLKLGFAGTDYGYAIDLGLPSPSSSQFARDPEIKVESLWTGETLGRLNAFAMRNGPSVRLRTETGEWTQVFDRGSGEELDRAIGDAFPGAEIAVVNVDGYFEVEMRQHGLLRPLKAAELSDGTLRYLLLTAALLSPRPPSLMILNEPETSLHPTLLPPLARLIAKAAERSQIVVVSHARELLCEFDLSDVTKILLAKELGETVVINGDRPMWSWPSR